MQLHNMLLVFFYVCCTAMFYTKKSRVIEFCFFFHVFIIPRNSSKFYTMKLDNALTQKNNKKKVSCVLGNI